MSISKKIIDTLTDQAKSNGERILLSEIIDVLDADGSGEETELAQVLDKLGENIDVVDDISSEVEDPAPKPTKLRFGSGKSTLAVYFKEISKTPLLKKEQEIALAKKIDKARKGIVELRKREKIDNRIMKKLVALPTKKQRRAILAKHKFRKPKIERVLKDLEKLEILYSEGKEKIVLSNLRLVISIAKRYQNLGLPLSDLINEGNLGLIKTIDKFNYKLGFRFSTYATWYIRQAISRALTDKSRTIRLPAHVAEFMSKFVRAKVKLANRLNRAPKPHELAKELKIPVKRVIELMRVSQDTTSLDTPIGREKDTMLSEILEEEKPDVFFREINISFLYDELAKMLETLSDRERNVIRMRFGLDGETPKTLHDIGKEMKLTRERIRQIEESTLKKLKKLCLRRNVYEFLNETP